MEWSFITGLQAIAVGLMVILITLAYWSGRAYYVTVLNDRMAQAAYEDERRAAGGGGY